MEISGGGSWGGRGVLLLCFEELFGLSSAGPEGGREVGVTLWRSTHRRLGGTDGALPGSSLS